MTSIRDNRHIPEEDKDFFILLRTGLWQQAHEDLSPCPNWEYIYHLSTDQTVQGIVADGIGIYRRQHPHLHIPQHHNDHFLSAAANIIRQNHHVNQVQTTLCHLLTHGSTPAASRRNPGDDTIPYVILKGQGVATCYPKPMLRCSGDIDLFFTQTHYQRTKEILKPLSTTYQDKALSLECALTIDGIDVELHGAMTSGINPHCDHHLQTILHKVLHEGDTRTVTINGTTVTLPSPNFDALYILTHTIRHLGAFGISLRQVIDWVMLLHTTRHTIDTTRLHHDIQAMHLQNLWALFTTFAVEYLGLPLPVESPKDPTTITTLWQIIKASGSFGRNNPYYHHAHAGRLNERLSRIYYRTLQAIRLGSLDPEFSNHLLRQQLQDTIVAPFRYLFLGGNKIQKKTH